MKSRLVSTLLFLIINFLVALVVHIVMGRLFHNEQLIDWITVLIITVVLTLFSARTIGRTADTMEKEGFGAALKSLFVTQKPSGAVAHRLSDKSPKTDMKESDNGH